MVQQLTSTKLNPITGSDEQITIKSMCINCVFCNSNMSCGNEDNKELARKQFIESIKSSTKPSGYDIESISVDLKPVPLRDVTKKCSRHELDVDVIISYLLPTTPNEKNEKKK